MCCGRSNPFTCASWTCTSRRPDSIEALEDAWDNQIEEDIKAGRLNDLIAQAEADIAAGRVKPLDEVLGDG